MGTPLDRLIAEIRQWVCDCGLSRAEIARRAGLHPNTMTAIGQEDWRPATKTLHRLDRLRHELSGASGENAA